MLGQQPHPLLLEPVGQRPEDRIVPAIRQPLQQTPGFWVRVHAVGGDVEPLLRDLAHHHGLGHAALTQGRQGRPELAEVVPADVGILLEGGIRDAMEADRPDPAPALRRGSRHLAGESAGPGDQSQDFGRHAGHVSA